VSYCHHRGYITFNNLPIRASAANTITRINNPDPSFRRIAPRIRLSSVWVWT
jgi:hypothetical protein